MKHLPFFATLLIAITIIGCSDTPRPDGLPTLYPCTITIKQDGKPLEGADILLYDPAITDRWIVAGQTDTSGVAVLRTHGQFPGAPEGRFKVVVSKTESEGRGWSGDEPRATWEDIKVYSFVAKEYGNRESTPLEIVIDGKKKSETFDLGTAERILIQTVRKGDI